MPDHTDFAGSWLSPSGQFDDDSIELFPIAISIYEQHTPLPVEDEVEAVRLALVQFGAVEIPWKAPQASRGADAVSIRLQQWAYPKKPSNTILYWVGHGWSDGLDVALAHARSPQTVRIFGVTPAQVAESVRTRQSIAEGRWAVIIIETCWSSRFVDKVNALLAEGPIGADAVLLVGVSGDGAGVLGRFRAALHACLQETFRSNRRIELWRLAGELDRRLAHGLVIGRRLGDAALNRATTPIAATVSVPLDILRLLEEVVNRLSEDERRHFLTKAQAAEEGEISWFFQGRRRETGLLSRWLREASSGLLVVTGAAGSGKSALLGHMLVHSLPDLRKSLIRADLIDPVSPEASPPELVFDAVVHLAGMSTSTFVARIAASAGVGIPPSAIRGSGVIGVMIDITWLIDTLASLGDRFTVLVDALDEAQDPIALAGSVLRPMSRLDNVRLIVDTRASTRESPDYPAETDMNLLTSLGLDPNVPGDGLLRIERDDDAVERYVAKRLTVAQSHDHALGDVDTHLLLQAARNIALRHQHFLFARLAVYELIARPQLLNPRQSNALHDLLSGDHRDLFAVAVARLSQQSVRFLPLLKALALARGRGVPIRDGVWTAIANALSHDTGTVVDQDITSLLAQAQPYIAIDEQQNTTVYRLAHRTFVEHFTTLWRRHG